MEHERPVVRVCETCAEAEDLIMRLEHAHCDMKSISIVGVNLQQEGQVAGCYTAGDRMRLWGMMGAFWGGVWGIFSGSAYFQIPGLGPTIVGGPLVDAMAGALERSDGEGGLSVLGVGLHRLGVPKSAVASYEAVLREAKLLLIASAGDESSTQARNLILDVGRHDPLRAVQIM
jgi:hypothetical protein